jgi:hypothetical protein
MYILFTKLVMDEVIHLKKFYTIETIVFIYFILNVYNHCNYISIYDKINKYFVYETISRKFF